MLMYRFSVLLAALFFASSAVAETVSPWQPSTKSAARLIADEGLRGGVYHAGVEIRLDPKTITYWRTPGEAGVPPVFDFSASVNVAKADVLYPVPKRLSEAGGVEAFGYVDTVIFPILVTPKDASQPVHLEMELAYAACEKICVPAQAHASLDLRLAGGISSGAIGQAEAAVPVILAAGAAGFSVKARAPGSKAGWTISVPGTTLAARDVFVEGLEGWFFDSKPGAAPGEFEIELADAPKGADLPRIPVTLTFTGAGRAVEIATALDWIVH